MNASKRPKTKGLKKLTNYLDELILSEEFQKQIIAIRERNNITIKKLPHNHNAPIFNVSKEYEKYLNLLMQRFSLPGDNLKVAVHGYILFNQYRKEWLSEFIPSDMCLITDVRTEEESIRDLYRDEAQNVDIESHQVEQIDMDKNYPILIRVSPYASMNDVTSFLKANTNYLKSLQENYKDSSIKIGSKRGSTVRVRNDFIYRHRNLPRKKIVSLVKEKFNREIDIDNVKMVIKREIDRRK